MLVYGDHQRVLDPAEELSRHAEASGRCHGHEELRARFIALAEVAQGVADADFHAAGMDRERPDEATLLASLTELGGLLMKSWDAGCVGGVLPPLRMPSGLPGSVTARLAEGYAFYALYPESYGLAARRLDLLAPPLVIGLRSIGGGLAAIAAAALEAPPPVTLRPSGDPFARTLRLTAELGRDLLAADRHFVIVDEGPGLSGSSFGCVADWLEGQGIASTHIAFLPGHEGDLGPEAATHHRRRWAEAQRPVVRVERLRQWVEEAIGPIKCWTDLSAGAWRPLWSAAESDWPPVTPSWERSKFLVRSGEESWLVRFAGLGRTGEEKRELAGRLHEAGFGPEVRRLTHGWLILRWHEDARPARPTIAELEAYLRLRSGFGAPQGASLDELVVMVRRNAPLLADWAPDTARLQRLVRPVRIDGRLAAHEWLRLGSGRLLKADALDHHQAHDLVGCQDIAWDLAGAILELDLAGEDADRLATALRLDPDLLRFSRIAYAAFRLGAHRLSEAMVDDAEAARHRAVARRFELALVDSVEDGRDVHQPLGLGVEAGT